MAKFERPNNNKEQPQEFDRYQWLSRRISEFQYRPLKGGPEGSSHIATWWLNKMQTGKDRFESEAQHAARALIAFQRFVRLDDSQRAGVIKGVTVRGCAYRGDEYDQYVEIVKSKIENENNPDFKAEVIKKMKSLRIGK